MATGSYSLAEVLEVARIHPFYNPGIVYPPDIETIQRLQESIGAKAEPPLHEQQLLTKKALYTAIARLTHDYDPLNTYRRSSYMSITGGGSGGVPMMFAVDVHENRRQRAQMGNFIKICGVIQPGDWALSIHLAGGFYRSLDLTTEILENAGATVLSAGNNMPLAEVARSLADYHVNVLTGDGSQIVQVVYHISMMSKEDRDRIKLDKIVYTSEPLTGPQRVFINAILSGVKIISFLGSTEAGAWAISNPDLTGEQDSTGSSADFVFDRRNVLIEIISPSKSDESPLDLSPLPQGEQGLIVQTSLQRLRNPLVRYITGDIGSLHPLPEMASAIIPEADREHIRVLRMKGRDTRFSFKWYGCYFEFEMIQSLMNAKECGILQWQIILDGLETTPQATLEVRLLRSPPGEGIMSDDDVTRRMEAFFLICPENENLARIVFVDGLDGFERSATARKVIKFVDRWNR